MSYIFCSADGCLRSRDGAILTKETFAPLLVHDTEIKIKYTFGSGQYQRNNTLSIKLSRDSQLEDCLVAASAAYMNSMRRMDDFLRLINTSITPETADNSTGPLDEVDWVRLVYEEEEYRKSDDIMRKYAELERDESNVDWIQFTADFVQPQILRNHGIEVNAFNLHKLRVAAQKTDVFWVKYNRARKGELVSGDPVPESVWLHDVESGTSMNLYHRSLQLLTPMVLLAGSIS